MSTTQTELGAVFKEAFALGGAPGSKAAVCRHRPFPGDPVDPIRDDGSFEQPLGT